MMLNPYTVLDLTDERGEIGPMVLGDLGANVIKIEPPGGSSARACAPLFEGAPADLQSLQFTAFNRNKRSIVLDPASSDDKATLEELIRRADIIVESSHLLDDYGVDVDTAAKLNPRIVHVRVTPFGDDGPHSELLGNDLVVAAMGGPVSLQGSPERAPVRVSVPQVWRHAGIEAAAGALVAHARMLRTGSPQFVDLSAQSVMTWTMLNAMDAHAIQGFDFERGSSGMGGGNNELNIVHPTADGYMVALPMSRVLIGCREWMIADGVVDATTMDIDWQEYDLNARDPDAKPMNLAQGTDILRRFLAKHTNEELFEFGLEHSITLAPINSLTELLALEHMEIRDYWRSLELAEGVRVKSPGLWAKSSNPLSVRSIAPKLDEHGDEIRAELAQPAPPREDPAPEGDDVLPFEGVKVADFAWVGVGPISSKYLADHGATVVRVESESRPDVLRGGAPFKDDEQGWNRSQFFGDFNTSKQSLTLDMKSPDAIDIAKKLIGWSDVLVESFAPGAIERMGLGYDEVKKLNPSIIMIGTCLMGQTGPAAGLAGYGYHAGAIAGFYEITGWPDLAPSGPWMAYTDTIAPRFVSVLLAAALDHRRRTGEGCYIDVAQIETALHFLAPELLHLQANGHDATRIGNRSPYLAPQGCYRCAGEDDWCAIAVDTDEQWAALTELIGHPDWATSLPRHSDRLAAHDEIDAAITAWTQTRSATALMETLQTAGVPAGVVQRSRDLLADPQYAHRRFYRHMDHPEMGNIPYAGHQYVMRGYDNGPRGPAPMLGEHSFAVLSDILGFSDEEIGNAFASGAIT
jgi:crotonobetainyl-CoA:carnitine CoA-transferase CaiB-like acyl-CoA transferase